MDWVKPNKKMKGDLKKNFFPDRDHLRRPVQGGRASRRLRGQPARARGRRGPREPPEPHHPHHLRPRGQVAPGGRAGHGQQGPSHRRLLQGACTNARGGQFQWQIFKSCFQSWRSDLRRHENRFPC